MKMRPVAVPLITVDPFFSIWSCSNTLNGEFTKSWTEKPSSFSLSADAGLDISFRIWRFDLKLMPAFHYNITNNYIYHLQEGVKGSDEVILSTVKPIKWFFSFNGGFAFRF